MVDSHIIQQRHGFPPKRELTIQLPHGTEQYENDIRRFVDAMLFKLELHKLKGRWSDETMQKVMQKLAGEVNELQQAINHGNTIQIILEAADVANYAMIAASIAVEGKK